MAHAAPATRRDRPPAVDVAANLAAVNAEVQEAARDAGRSADEITLIAVSKGHPASLILPALAAGHVAFGENRVQEATEKWRALRADWPGAALHYIGALQTNKAREAVAVADAIHAIDRPKLANALAREMDRQARRPDCFIQVNTGAEPQKAGVQPENLDELVALCRDDLKLPVVGLMCIPPAAEDPALTSRCCASSPRATGSDASAWACRRITGSRSRSAPPTCASARRFSAHGPHVSPLTDRAGRAAGSGLDERVDRTVLDDEVVARDGLGARRPGRGAGPDIEEAAVQRAFDQPAIDVAFRKRGMAVRAGVVGGEIGATQIVDGDRRQAVGLDPQDFVLRHLGGAAEKDLVHRPHLSPDSAKRCVAFMRQNVGVLRSVDKRAPRRR